MTGQLNAEKIKDIYLLCFCDCFCSRTGGIIGKSFWQILSRYGGETVCFIVLIVTFPCELFVGT
jgi:hypothetical protein